MEDLEFLSEAQAIANYEDELAWFVDEYTKSKEYRKEIRDKYGLYLDYEPRDECMSLNDKEGLIEMSIHDRKLLEKMFNIIQTKDRERILEEECLPF